MKANLEDRRLGIPLMELSKTFQDAVQIARSLNVAYIWIDSLCIVQDDPEDWKAEAAKMSRIYQGAMLMVAATGSASGKGGCFLKRSPCGPLVKLPYYDKRGINTEHFFA
jgi:hypothetical protein